MTDSLLNLKTEQSLVSALRSAIQRKPSPVELFEQRVSFVYSSMGSKTDVTRDRVRELVRQYDEVVEGV